MILEESSAHTQTHTCRIRLKSNSRLKNSKVEARNSLLYWILRSGLQLSAVSIKYRCLKVLCVFSVFRMRRPWGDEKGGDSKSCSHPAQSRLMVHTLLWSLSRAKPRPPTPNPSPRETHALALSLSFHSHHHSFPALWHIFLSLVLFSIVFSATADCLSLWYDSARNAALRKGFSQENPLLGMLKHTTTVLLFAFSAT